MILVLNFKMILCILDCPRLQWYELAFKKARRQINLRILTSLYRVSMDKCPLDNHLCIKLSIVFQVVIFLRTTYINNRMPVILWVVLKNCIVSLKLSLTCWLEIL